MDLTCKDDHVIHSLIIICPLSLHLISSGMYFHDFWGVRLLSLVEMEIVFDCCTGLVQGSHNLG